MIYPISKLSGIVYVRVAKPILFKFKADDIHSFIAKTSEFFQKIPFATNCISIFWRYENSKLNQTLLGVDFKNPIGLSAGFDKEARLAKMLFAIGFGQAEMGSITAEPYEGNKKPWYTRLRYSKSILVNSGLKSSGVTKIADKADKMKISDYKNIVINASVAKTNSPECNTVEKGIEDYCKSLKRLEKSPWPKMYTINISCPNTSGGEPFNKPDNLKQLLNKINSLNLSKPVFLKLPISLEWSETYKLIDVAAKSSISGLTLGNLSKDRSLVDNRDNLSDSQKGNLSGKPCWGASNLLLANCYTNFGDRFIYSGVGGVFTAEDAYLKIKLGASLVELITGMIFKGPTIIGQINKELVKLMEDDGYANIGQAVGVEAKKYLKENT